MVLFVVVSKFLMLKEYRGITLWPFIVMRDRSLKDDAVFMNHEKIHLKQQLEMLVLLFYVWYLLEFLIRLAYHRCWNTAYENISFEREAYAKEKDLHYLKSRSFFGFFKYILK